MIVKFFSRGRGSCSATIDYMLGKDRAREQAKILQGDPELTRHLADNAPFKNRYTVGVLSFQENNLDDRQKTKIMSSFEQSLLAGLQPNQYNICWIEHRDKDRLELNFIIPNIELTTGKRLQPYFDRADRLLVENWKQVINHEYGLSDPHDPQKSQAFKIDLKSLPESVQATKEQIGRVISTMIDKGAVTSRTDVLDVLQKAGFEIVRTTDKSISIKNPNGKRNIRLEGFIYENRRFSGELGAERTRARQNYERTTTERYQSAFGKLQQAITIKSERNSKYYQKPPNEPTRQSTSLKNQQNYDRGSVWDFDNIHGGLGNGQPMDLQKIADNGGTVGTDRTKYQSITNTSESLSKIGNRAEPRRQNLDTTQEPQKIPNRQRRQQRQSPNYFGVESHAKRLYECLQQLTERLGATTNPTHRDQQQASRTDRAIAESQSVLERTEQQIKQREQQANELVAEQQKSLNNGRGFGR